MPWRFEFDWDEVRRFDSELMMFLYGLTKGHENENLFYGCFDEVKGSDLRTGFVVEVQQFTAKHAIKQNQIIDRQADGDRRAKYFHHDTQARFLLRIVDYTKGVKRKLEHRVTINPCGRLLNASIGQGFYQGMSESDHAGAKSRIFSTKYLQSDDEEITQEIVGQHVSTATDCLDYIEEKLRGNPRLCELPLDDRYCPREGQLIPPRPQNEKSADQTARRGR